MKNFEFVTASSNDFHIALKNLKEGIIKQFGTSDMSIDNIFVSQQMISTVQFPNGVLVFHITAQLGDNKNDIVDKDFIEAASGLGKKIFDQDF